MNVPSLQSKDLDQDHAELWRSASQDGILLFKASFKKFAYQKHTHDEFAIGVIETGAQRFLHKGSLQTAVPGSVITVNPDEVHDGEPLDGSGYRYRMCYLEPKLVLEILQSYGADASKLGFFPQPVTRDSHLAGRILHCLRAFERPELSQLATQVQFAETIAGLFLRHTREARSEVGQKLPPPAVSKATEFIFEHASQAISLQDVAGSVNMSRYHFLRLFRNATGLPPHAFLVQRRVQLAREKIEAGYSLAQAALASGFADQSHLTRRFKAIYGLTPGQYRRALPE